MYKDLLAPVQVKGLRGRIMTVPAIFVALSGPVTRMKTQVANKAIVDWQLRLKKKRVGKNGCPWHQPSTQCVEYRSFLAWMKSNHDWDFCEGSFTGFEGCVTAVLNDLFAAREKEWVSVFLFYYAILILNTYKLTVIIFLGTERLR